MEEQKKQEETSEWFKQELNRIRQEEILAEELVSNEDYIKWLEKFTEKYSDFCDDDFLYNDGSISVKDKENVEKLDLFFKGISMYAQNNYIYAKTQNSLVFGNYYYNITANNITYEIGMMFGQGTICYCNRYDDNIDDAIDFNDIIVNKKQANVDFISENLKVLSEQIVSMLNKEIPKRAIRECVNKVLRE